MPVTVTLNHGEQTVDAGGSATFDVQLHNTDDSAQTVRLTVSGPAAPFSWTAPETVSIEAGGVAAARVGFHLPAGSNPPAGPLPFEVKALVSADGSRPATDGVLHLAPFSSLSATLDPPQATGKGTARYQLTVSNRGNAPVRVELGAEGDEVDVGFAPPTVTASPDEPGLAAVDVTPRRRLLTGADRARAFSVVATPEVGNPVSIPGRLVQRAVVATRTLVRSGVVAGLAVVALVVATGAFSDGASTVKKGNPSPAPPDGAPRTGADCPAAGHIDRFGISGLRLDDIYQLPNTYSFFAVKSDGCTPIRFNPCQPVHYVQNAAAAPPTGVADVQEAFRQLSQATGITFVDDGLTDETERRRPYVPERYGPRWAPILVSWMHFGDQGPDPAIQVVGRGIGQRVNDVIVSGTLSLNVDAVTDKDAGTPLEGGFGPPLGSGTGSIGPKGVTWGRVILHELAHVVGLGHTKDKGAIMYPETADQTSRPAAFREPDLAGLRFLGREAGCLRTPPVPAG